MMYLPHFGLNEKPFTACPDPRYLWFGDRQLGAYASLEAAILQGSGIIVVTGDVGTGKTTFIKGLAAGLQEKTMFSYIPDPALNEPDFYRLVAHGFGTDRLFESRNEFIGYLRAIAREAAKLRKRAVVVVDESQRIDLDLLKIIWLLARQEPDLAIAVTWIFVGQDEMLDKFNEEKLWSFDSKKVDQFHMHPLDKDETGAYIRFRMKRAGAQQTVFTEPAIRRIYQYTTGHPRLINSICDLALLYGFAEKTRKIESKIIDACTEKICLPKRYEVKRAFSKGGLKTAACLFASLFCLTMSGFLTYLTYMSDNRPMPTPATGASLQSILPGGDVQTSLSNPNLVPNNTATIFKIPPALAWTEEAGSNETRKDDNDAALAEEIPASHSLAAENHAPDEIAEEPPKTDEPGKRMKIPAPQKTESPSGSGSTANIIPPRDRKGRPGEDPDPVGIIDWLLEN